MTLTLNVAHTELVRIVHVLIQGNSNAETE